MESSRVATRSSSHSAAGLANPVLPGRESSGRKRVRKTMGPDFIQDFYPGATRGSEQRAEAMKRAALHASEREMKMAKSSPEIDAPRTALSSAKVVMSEGICQICQKPDAADKAEILVHCKGRGCRFEAHVGCLKGSAMIQDSGEDDVAPHFRCGRCKRCCVCGKKKPPEAELKSVTCAGCQRLFHMRCHFPNVAMKLPDWRCSNCSAGKSKEQKIDFSIRKSSRTSTKKVEEKEMAKFLPRKSKRSSSDESKVPEVSSQSGDSDCMTEEKSGNGKESVSSAMADSRDLEVDRLVFTSEEALTPERKRSITPDDINPHFVYMLERHQVKLTEESELRQDLAMWSVEQCAAYFVDSLPELAELITNHDLFGSSLMIISRAQFSELFRLPLGKTLTFFNAICQWRRTTF